MLSVDGQNRCLAKTFVFLHERCCGLGNLKTVEKPAAGPVATLTANELGSASIPSLADNMGSHSHQEESPISRKQLHGDSGTSGGSKSPPDVPVVVRSNRLQEEEEEEEEEEGSGVHPSTPPSLFLPSSPPSPHMGFAFG
ncbi:hypothetical protein NQZ68_034789 [Dissostichus eleginoides]|nr:hypothetical protein NQZ68_034789 [Dissostichus eleginoides]